VRLVAYPHYTKALLPFSSAAKMRTRLIAAQTIKAGKCAACKSMESSDDEQGWEPPPDDCSCATNNFCRGIYLRERMRWIDKEVDTKPVTRGHAHNHAPRVVGHEVLRSMYTYTPAA
jgi:hypothetical protein